MQYEYAISTQQRAFCTRKPTFSTKTHCIQHQNALCLAPKRIAFSTKMHCKMRQNADQYAAKRKAKCNNMYNEMQQNTVNLGTQGIYFDGMMCGIRAKYTPNRGFLGAKCRYLELKKTRIGNHLERQNGAKCTPCS